jgi:hypothetical protein
MKKNLMFVFCLMPFIWASCMKQNSKKDEGTTDKWAEKLASPEKLTMSEKVKLADTIFQLLSQKKVSNAEDDGLTFLISTIFSNSGYITIEKKDATSFAISPDVFAHRLRLLPAKKLVFKSFSMTEYNNIQKTKMPNQDYIADITNHINCKKFNDSGLPIAERVSNVQFKVVLPDTTLKSYNRIFQMIYSEQ